MAVLGLRFRARALSSCGERGPLLIAVRGPHRGLSLQSTGSRRADSVVVAHGLSRSAACGILPDQGSNLRPLHWQADSQPLRHQLSFSKRAATFSWHHCHPVFFEVLFMSTPELQRPTLDPDYHSWMLIHKHAPCHIPIETGGKDLLFG